jgi:hypothetical protein
MRELPWSGAAAVRSGPFGLPRVRSAALAGERTLDDASVLAAVAQLSAEGELPPSTTTIVAYLSGEQPFCASLQTVVRQTLERLCHHGRLDRLTVAGTHRWRP